MCIQPKRSPSDSAVDPIDVLLIEVFSFAACCTQSRLLELRISPVSLKAAFQILAGVVLPTVLISDE